MDAADLAHWGRAFALTELVEAPIYRAMLGVSVPRALAASAITHPFVWFVFPWAGQRLGLSWVETSVLSEIFAFAVEASFFRFTARVPWRRAALASLVANGASVAFGLFLRRYFGAV